MDRAGHDSAENGGKALGGPLQNVAPDPSNQEGMQVGGFFVRGEDDNEGHRVLRPEFGSNIHSGHAGHRNIQDQQVRLKRSDEFEGLPSIAGVANDLDVGLIFEEHGKPVPEEVLVICEYHSELQARDFVSRRHTGVRYS